MYLVMLLQCNLDLGIHLNKEKITNSEEGIELINEVTIEDLSPEQAYRQLRILETSNIMQIIT